MGDGITSPDKLESFSFYILSSIPSRQMPLLGKPGHRHPLPEYLFCSHLSLPVKAQLKAEIVKAVVTKALTSFPSFMPPCRLSQTQTGSDRGLRWLLMIFCFWSSLVRKTKIKQVRKKKTLSTKPRTKIIGKAQYIGPPPPPSLSPDPHRATASEVNVCLSATEIPVDHFLVQSKKPQFISGVFHYFLFLPLHL